MPGELTVRIRTERLAQASGDISRKVSDLKAAFEEMTEAVGRTNSYWRGEAADAHRRVYRQMQPRQEEALKRLLEQVRDLAQIAGVWEATEQEVKEVDLTLPDDVIL